NLHYLHPATPLLKTAIKHLRTKYLTHRYLAPNFQYLLVLLSLHIFPLFLYDTMLEFDVPTIIDVKYTNHEYFLTNVNKFLQSDLEQSLPFHSYFVIPQPDRLMVAYLQTIVLTSKVLQLHHYAQSDLLGVRGLLCQIIRPLLVNHSRFASYIQSDLILHIYLRFHSSSHLHS